MTQRRAEARPPVTLAVVVQLALRILEEEGLEALTMRRIAARLDMQAASLYWHIRNKDELLDLVADALLNDLDLSQLAGPGGTWQEVLAELCTVYRDYLKSRRDAARVLAGRFIAGPAFLRNSEIMLGLLEEAGLSPKEAAYALHMIVTYVQGFVLQETIPMSAKEVGDDRQSALTQLRRSLEDLPAGDFPRVRAGAADLASPEVDSRFAFGIRCITEGLTAMAADSSARERPTA